MFRFDLEQKIFDIGGLKIGGQPGQLPTVMIGSIFYHHHKIVSDEKTGAFDQKKAEQILIDEENVSAKTGNQRIIDICASFCDAFPKEIAFVADTAKGPFTIDGTTAEVRMTGAKYVKEAGLSQRAVYNSINPQTRDEELQAIRDAKITSAILLTLNTTNPTLAGRLSVIENLIQKASTAGIDNMLIDTTILDIPDPGPAGKTVYMVKEKYGLPAGCGAHNAVDIWHKRRNLDPDTRLTSSVVANALPIIMGANFMLYGPIENAAKMYMPIALTDAYIAYSMSQEYRMKPLTNNHPLYRIFKS